MQLRSNLKPAEIDRCPVPVHPLLQLDDGAIREVVGEENCPGASIVKCDGDHLMWMVRCRAEHQCHGAGRSGGSCERR